jgi:hypothetical protein
MMRKSQPKTLETKSSSTPENIILQRMKEYNVPLTRQNYLDMAYMGNPPDEIGGEIEASIPKEIGEAEDVAWMAELGVGWVPENDDDED